MHVGVQVKGKSSVTKDTGGKAQIVDLDEIIGVSGLLAGALEMSFSNDFNFHDVSPLPFSVFVVRPETLEFTGVFRRGRAFK